MSLIELQDAYIARVSLAHSKITARTKGFRFQRTVKAAKTELRSRLGKFGYTADAIELAIKDAHDMFLLEAACDSTT